MAISILQLQLPFYTALPTPDSATRQLRFCDTIRYGEVLQHRGAVQPGQTLHAFGDCESSGSRLAHPQGAVFRNPCVEAMRQDDGDPRDAQRDSFCTNRACEEADFRRRRAYQRAAPSLRFLFACDFPSCVQVIRRSLSAGLPAKV